MPEKQTILILDADTSFSESLVAEFMKIGYDCRIFTDPGEALGHVREEKPHLAFVDIAMPGTDGPGLIGKLLEADPEIGVVMTAGYTETDAAAAAMKMGALDFIAKPAEFERFSAAARIALERRRLRLDMGTGKNGIEGMPAERDRHLAQLNRNMEENFLETIKTFTGLIERRDEFIGGHSRRVAAACRAVCGKFDLRDTDIEHAALLHDIGKIVFPDAVLRKTENFFTSMQLTEEEKIIVRLHPIIGQDTVEMISLLHTVSIIIRHHHEYFNGSGYPDQLSDCNIPLGSRIIAVVDIYDNVVNGVDKKRRPEARKFVIDHLGKNSGVLYDPDVVKFFLEFIGEHNRRVKGRKERIVAVDDLRPGMVLARDISTAGGVILASRDDVLTPGDASRIRRFLQRRAVESKTAVYEESTPDTPQPAVPEAGSAPGEPVGGGKEKKPSSVAPAGEIRAGKGVNRTDIARFKRVKDAVDGAKDLGTLQGVYQNAVRLLNDPASTRRDIALVLKQDQAIVAKVLRVVNSPLFAFSRQITTIEDAIPLLGFSEIRNIVTSVSVITMFGSAGGSDIFDRTAFWKHSTASAIICKILARKLKIPSEEECFTAALLHDIGKLVFDQLFPDNFRKVVGFVREKEVSMREAELMVFGRPHHIIGGYLLRKWNIPDVLAEAVSCHHSPGDAKLNPYLASAVHTADIISHMMGIGESGEWRTPELDEAARRQLGIEPGSLERFIPEIGEELKQSGDLLNLGD